MLYSASVNVESLTTLCYAVAVYGPMSAGDYSRGEEFTARRLLPLANGSVTLQFEDLLTALR